MDAGGLRKWEAGEGVVTHLVQLGSGVCGFSLLGPTLEAGTKIREAVSY